MLTAALRTLAAEHVTLDPLEDFTAYEIPDIFDHAVNKSA